MKSPGWLLCICMIACGGNNTESPVNPPGKEKDAKSRTLEAGADLLQQKSPLRKVNVYLNGFHFYNGNTHAQMEAHHYVSQINEEVHQAIIYDGNGEDARIMGVEYIISARLFQTLPPEEKKLWHSHDYEVHSGELIAPGLPQAAEHELMEKLVSTYGKTIHTWHTDRDLSLPVGSPQIMMAFTAAGQIDQEMLTKRDRRFRVSTAAKRKNRSDIPHSPVDTLANAWQRGELRQLTISTKAGDSHGHN